MVGSISSIGSGVQPPSSEKLTEETKKKLEALGINTSEIKTESQGLALLSAAKKTQQVKASSGNAQEESIKEKVKELAASLSINANSKDSLDDILKKISSKIEELKAQAANDPVKLKKVEGYQAQFDAIVGSVSSMQQQKQAQQGQLSGSLDGMALYNKVKLGLG